MVAMSHPDPLTWMASTSRPVISTTGAFTEEFPPPCRTSDGSDPISRVQWTHSAINWRPVPSSNSAGPRPQRSSIAVLPADPAQVLSGPVGTAPERPA